MPKHDELIGATWIEIVLIKKEYFPRLFCVSQGYGCDYLDGIF